MDLDTFLGEAQRLSRTCTVFHEFGDSSPAAYWHGVAPGLCLSLLHNDRWLNVFLHDDCEGGHVEVANYPATSDVPLYSEPYTSLPPVDAVFFCGSDAIGEFLQQHDWPRNEPFNDNFADSIPGEYERIWQDNCPIYRSDLPLMSGGWHMPWPDGDWYEFVDAEQIAWTFLDSEPWVEVFKLGDGYTVKQRIT